MTPKEKHAKIFAVVILTIMFFLLVSSVWNESAIIDELAHIPAGFGYLRGDYRLNPEHPPLLKTMAALSSWIMTRPNFPTETKAWAEDVNGQWDQGTLFFYESDNNADRLIFWARFPLILLTILFGWLFFLWTQKRFGSPTALFSLAFFAFSPTFLTHSRYVTTDLGASFAFFIGIVGFISFLENPTWRNTLIAGLIFGLAELFKFSLVLLMPIYGFLWIAWVYSLPELNLRQRFQTAFRLLVKIIILGIVGFLLVWGVYAFHNFNYPRERQIRDTRFLLSSFGFRPAAELNETLAKNNFTRPFAQYMLGVLMVNQRASGGNTQYFRGEVSAAGFRSYFPILYLTKETLAFHILTLIALWLAIKRLIKKRQTNLSFEERIRSWIYFHFPEFASITFITAYWLASIASPLNIGIRHVLPTFPFIYLLVAGKISQWLKEHDQSSPANWVEWLKNAMQIYVRSIPKVILTGILLLWMVISPLKSYPDFMTYFNEIAGGSGKGYEIAVDSNYDWGQDLKRLRDYTEKNGIEKIHVDYFGGGQLKYYFGEKADPWWSSRGPVHGWFAISSTFRQGAFGKTVEGFTRKPEDSYEWLKPYSPIAKIGSMFLYKLP